MDGVEEFIVGNAFGGNLGSHGGRVLLLNHVQGVEPSLWGPHILEPAADQ